MTLTISANDEVFEVRSDDVVLTRYRASEQSSKSAFDTIATPPGKSVPSGRNVVLSAPHDHPWHRGLFFCQKLINGINCWEAEHHVAENRIHGRQTVGSIDTETFDDSVQIHQESAWVTSDSNRTLLDDTRTITIQAPSDGQYFILWEQELTAPDEIRYLTSESLYGRYGGLCVRFSRELDAGTIRLADEENPEPSEHSPSPWCDYTGQLDGSEDVEHPYTAGITLMHHPANDEYGMDWFTRREPYGLVTANPVWDRVIPIPAGDSIQWRWGVLVHAGDRSREEIETAYEAYTQLVS